MAPVTRGAGDDLGRRFLYKPAHGLVNDLGCGPGRYLDQIGGPVVGLDVCGAMLALARQRGHPLARRVPRSRGEADLLATVRR